MYRGLIPVLEISREWSDCGIKVQIWWIEIFEWSRERNTSTEALERC